MSVVVIGLNHRSMPLELFERMTIDDGRLPKALHEMASQQQRQRDRRALDVQPHRGLRGRREVPRRLRRHPQLPRRDRLPRARGLRRPPLRPLRPRGHPPPLHRHRRARLGGRRREPRSSARPSRRWSRAKDEGASGPVLNLLFRHAIEVGKRARTDTDIARGTASVSYAAVEMAADRARLARRPQGARARRRRHGRGHGRRAGQRRRRRDQGRQPHLGPAPPPWPTGSTGVAVRLSDLPEALAEVDVLLTSTGATSIMLEHADLEPIVEARDGRPLLVVDIAVPRDIDPSVADLARRHAARHARPAPLRAGRRAGARARGRVRSSASSSTRSTASSRPAPAGPRPRSSPRCTPGPRSSARPSSSASAPGSARSTPGSGPRSRR